jgi:hypothetical protein
MATAEKIHTRKKATVPLCMPKTVASKMASVAAAIETVPQAIRRSLSFTLKSVRPLYPVCVNVDDAPRADGRGNEIRGGQSRR